MTKVNKLGCLELLSEDWDLNPGVDYRIVKDYPDYRVGNDGSVWSKSFKGIWIEMHPSTNSDGYYQLKLYGLTIRSALVQYLVLETFIGPCPSGMECCHRNDIKTDNRWTNLYWGTDQDNGKDRVRNGRSARGEQQAASVLLEEDIPIIKQRRENGETLQELADYYEVSPTAIRYAINGTNWKYVK